MTGCAVVVVSGQGVVIEVADRAVCRAQILGHKQKIVESAFGAVDGDPLACSTRLVTRDAVVGL